MPEVRVTRRLHFSAAHRLFRSDWSEARNVEVFGDCSHPNWHGHNYTLEITVEGEPDPKTGYVIDLGELKRIGERELVDHMDHKNLNLDVPFLRGTIPTAENIAVASWDRLEPSLQPYSGCQLQRIRLYESRNNFVEYRGQRAP